MDTMNTINISTEKFEELVRSRQMLETLCRMIAFNEPYEIKAYRTVAEEELIPLTDKEKEKLGENA